MKKSMKFSFIIIISIILSISFGGCLSEDKVKTITAKEGAILANDEAKDWHEDPELIEVASMGDDNNQGGSIKWEYVYFSKSSAKIENNVTKYEHLYIYVNSNKEVKKNSRWNVITEENITIKNWTLDNDEAVDIAKENHEIESYLNKYEDASLGMTLMMWDNLPNGEKNPNNDSATWSVHWESSSGLDSPVHAKAFVDAESGELLYAEADD